MTTKTYTSPKILEDLLTGALHAEMQELKKAQAAGYHDSVPYAEGRITGLIGALYFLTREDHEVIRARAEQDVSAVTSR